MINMFGALGLAISDRINAAATGVAGSTPTAAAALVFIGFYPHEVSINALSQIVSLSHSGTVRLVDRLVADGLVERGRGVDARSVDLSLTKKGRLVKKKILGQRELVLRDIVEKLDEKETVMLCKITEKILGTLTTSQTEADKICRLCDEDACPESECLLDF